MPTSDLARAARELGARSRAAVAAGDREAWLALWDDDAIVQDPIGVSPLDPEGEGFRGRERIAAFWDTVIQGTPGARISFDYHTQYAVGDECACVGSLTNHLPDGSEFHVPGVFVYRATPGGKLASLRTYWTLEQCEFRRAGQGG